LEIEKEKAEKPAKPFFYLPAAKDRASFAGRDPDHHYDGPCG